MTYQINSDKTAAVSITAYYKEMTSCPIGVKVILHTPGGPGVVGEWDGRDFSYQGWYPMPRKRASYLRMDKSQERPIEHREYL